MDQNPYHPPEESGKMPNLGVDVEHLIGYNNKGTDWFLVGVVFSIIVTFCILGALFSL